MAAYLNGARLQDVQVGDIMTRDLCTVTCDTDLAEAEQLMQERQVRRLPVVENGCLVGIVSLADVARRGSDGVTHSRNPKTPDLIRTVERISQPR
jgi:CBS-domain-containing membrane protein